ncbi:AraC family transcriptional regulator [Sinomicrobium weinanense]|uniref:Helix-turn-helix transcriptional regulator n=1 Tax=Sinomicrobium weinanense TaxID=2842200 RepID=A0A926JU98_9FLAO|nr:helix-turn-helix transcriptional regulator [Sinomicrobium weinanense]MBC9797494.1 helix-turn-helix transcriptional regulator [Sinomicrobium weinanense]MBU3122220.1 helix-turn-helix transcriptional regulator [Sinomicrobium weinanense]
MNTEKETIISGLGLGFEINPRRPVTAYSKTITHGRCEAAHLHPRAQVIYADQGIMKVVTSGQLWTVTPTQGIWIPGLEEHQVYFPDNVRVRTLFFDPSVTKNLPDKCFAFDMNPLLKELILKMTSFPEARLSSPRVLRMAGVLVDELGHIKPASLFLPTSDEPRVQQVTKALIAQISEKKPLSFYAALAHVSTRTLSRLFIRELGMSFGEWRTRLKILEAIKQLNEQRPVKEIGYDLGYENPSTFIHMFRKYTGQSPARFHL